MSGGDDVVLEHLVPETALVPQHEASWLILVATHGAGMIITPLGRQVAWEERTKVPLHLSLPTRRRTPSHRFSTHKKKFFKKNPSNILSRAKES